MKQLLKFLLVLLPVFGEGSGYAQKEGQAAIDSMLKDLSSINRKDKEDTNRVKLLCSLSFCYHNINPDEGIKYAKQGLDLATKLGWKTGIALSNNNLGTNYRNKSDYIKAVEYFQTALKIDEETGNKKGIGNVSGNIGIVYASEGDYPEALEYFFKNLRIDVELNDKSGEAKDEANIGSVYRIQSDYPVALEYFFKALKIADEMGDNTSIASITESIGNVYSDQKDFSKALEYYLKSLKKDEELGNKNWIASNMGNIGVVYMSQNEYANALDYYFKALKIYEQIGDKQAIADFTSNIGQTYALQKNYSMAIDYEQKALDIAKGIGDKYQTALNLGRIGDCLLSIDTSTASNDKAITTNEPAKKTYIPNDIIPKDKVALLHKAIDYLQRSLSLSEELHAMDVVIEAYQNLSVAYRLSGDYKKALECTDSFTTIKDSVFSKENNEKIVKMGMQNEYDKKTAEAEKAAALKLQRQRNYTYTGISGMALLLVFTFFITRNNKLLAKEKKRSEDLLLNILPAEVANELKDTGSSAARHFDNVTVLFTDFVNFTQAGENMKPQALIDELHDCFKTFDEITGRYNIEKIKTIGDAYLAVCGLPRPDPKHAENTVRAAIEIIRFMEDRLAKLGNKTFEVRIGIHSGSVVAGIVGVKKFAYDIWGDTVNTAARMEQSSEAGKINISQATYELVKDKFTFEYRGEIEAKNKGALKMYFVAT